MFPSLSIKSNENVDLNSSLLQVFKFTAKEFTHVLLECNRTHLTSYQKYVDKFYLGREIAIIPTWAFNELLIGEKAGLCIGPKKVLSQSSVATQTETDFSVEPPPCPGPVVTFQTN